MQPLRSPWLTVGLAVAIVLVLVVGLIGLRLAAPSVKPLPPTPQAAAAPESASAPAPPVTLAAPPSTAAQPTAALPTVTLTAAATLSSAASPTAPKTPVAPTPGPTVAPDLALEYSKVGANEYLGSIAARYGVSVDDIIALSGIANPDVAAIGQGLIIPHRTDRVTPADVLVPDSEIVYGLAYADFDLAQFIADQGGYLAQVTAQAPDGATWSAADIIERVALRYSVGPRILLALMEARSGWVTNPDPQGVARDYPLGHTAGAPGLFAQLEWAANELNHGFYGWLDRGETAIRFRDGTLARGAPGLNPGTVAVQWALAGDSSFAELAEEQAAFLEAYRQLFGDPASHDAGPILPAGLPQPDLQLPWAPGEWWHLTGGPHGGWGSASGWAALDFVPGDAAIGGCWVADAWARAAAPGVVARNDGGEILLDLDGDGDVRTGWVLQYLHIANRVAEGSRLQAGDPVGQPSCEGGAADTTHLHFARRYNGVWVDAGGSVPMVLDGWTAYGGFEYEGGVGKPGMPDRVASHSRDREANGLMWAQ